MFWHSIDTAQFEVKILDDIASLFSDYGEVAQAVYEQQYGLVAASHLVNQIRLAGKGKLDLDSDSIEQEFFGILNMLDAGGMADSTTCLAPQDEGFDSIPYTLTRTSSTTPQALSMMTEAKMIIGQTSYKSVCEWLDNMAIITLEFQTFPNTNQSYTIQPMIRTVYLDLYEHPLLTAESLVHECSHLTFNNYCYQHGITFDPTPRFYSPWKMMKRPLFNFLHSLIAFTDVILFTKSAEAFIHDSQGRRYTDMKLGFELRNMLSVREAVEIALSNVDDRFIVERIRSGLERVEV